MTKHQRLEFRTFVESVLPETLERYFDSLHVEKTPSGWATLNGDALEEFLTQPANAELDALVRQDFRRINDLALKGPAILFDSYDRHQIPFDPTLQPEELALRAFLDHKGIWEFAWSRFLLFALDSKVSVYAFPPASLDFGPERIESFRESVSESFLHQAKGHECDVRPFDLDGEQIIYVKRGYYMRTVSRWEAEEIGILSYRPALEDVLAFDPITRQLTVKAAQEREREDYVRLFAHKFAGDMSLGEQAIRTPTFDLAPVAQETFNYQGGGLITGVHLVGVKLKLPFKRRAIMKLDSDNIFETLKALNLSFGVGDLVSARFRFEISEGKTARKMTFEVSPPSRTDLPETAYSSMINAYLKKQGVRLF